MCVYNYEELKHISIFYCFVLIQKKNNSLRWSYIFYIVFLFGVHILGVDGQMWLRVIQLTIHCKFIWIQTWNCCLTLAKNLFSSIKLSQHNLGQKGPLEIIYSRLLKTGPTLIRLPCLIRFWISPRNLFARRVELANCHLGPENLGLKCRENNKLLVNLVMLMTWCLNVWICFIWLDMARLVQWLSQRID